MSKRILVTLLFLGIYWIGKFVPVPGLNYDLLKPLASMFHQSYADMVIQRCSIFSLDFKPYVACHVLLFLLNLVIPPLRNGLEKGALNPNRLIYGGVIVLSFIEASLVALWMQRVQVYKGVYLASHPGLVFLSIATLSIMVGTLLIIWMSEQIDKHGIGHGISLFFLTNLLFMKKESLLRLGSDLTQAGDLRTLNGVVILLFVICLVGFMLTKEEKISLGKTPKDSVLRFPYLAIGIISIYFSKSILAFPATTKALAESSAKIPSLFNHDSWTFYPFSALLIGFFAYFCFAVLFNPPDLLSRLKKFRLLPDGMSENEAKKKFQIVATTKVVLVWSIFLCAVAFLPFYFYRLFGIYLPFSGFDLVLALGVILGVYQTMRWSSAWKEIVRCSNIQDVLAMKTRLEAEGISAVIDWKESYGKLLALPLGQLAEKRLLVRQADYGASVKLLNSFGVATPTNP